MKLWKFLLAAGLACFLGGHAHAQQSSPEPAKPQTVTLDPPKTEQQQKGKAVFDLWCGSCHKPLGPYVSSVAGTSVLERKYKGSKPAALEQRTDFEDETIKYYVRHGVKFMPHFRKTEITDADLDNLAAYLCRNSPKGN